MSTCDINLLSRGKATRYIAPSFLHVQGFKFSSLQHRFQHTLEFGSADPWSYTRVALWQWDPGFGIRDLGKILTVTGPASVAYPNRSLQDCGQRLMEQQEELLVENSEQPDVPQRQDFCSVSAIVVSPLP